MRGNTLEGVRHLDQAVSIGRDLFWSHYYRGLAAERLGEQAGTRVGYFAAVTELSPNFADGWYRLALARDAAGNVPGALEAARRSAELRSSWDDRFLLSYLLLKSGDAGKARPLLLQLDAERPGDPKVKYNLEYAAKITPSR